MTKMNVVIELPDGTIEIDYPQVPPEPVVSFVPTTVTPDVYGEVVVRYPDGRPVMDTDTGEYVRITTLLQRATYEGVRVETSTADRKLYDRSEDHYLNEMARRILDRNPGATLVGISLNIPDLTFRDALRRQGNGVSIHMPTARDIQAARIRAARDMKWKKLDALENEAISKDDADLIAAAREKKKAMRDIMQVVDGPISVASTPEALISAWPAELDR
jgi:hypothetical protein